MSPDDIPKKVQYIIVESRFVNGTNNTFSLDLTLESNTHVEDMSRVLGIKLVDFYVTEVGEANPNADQHTSEIPEYIDILCPEIPKPAQVLEERNGQVFARIPLERHYNHSASTIQLDKQWVSYDRKTKYFNPVSIKKLNFTINQMQQDGNYTTLQPKSEWYMVLEITTVNVKEKPKDRELQILMALEKLLKKIDILNHNVQKLPDKPPVENPKKYSFGLLVAILVSILGGFVLWVNKTSA